MIIKALVAVAGLAFSQEKAQELPTLEQFRDALRAAPAPPSPALLAGEAAPPRSSSIIQAQALNLDGAKLEGRWFSSTKDVKNAKGEEIGTLEVGGGGRIYKDKSGAVVVQGQIVTGRSWKITGAEGVIGSIEEANSGDDRVLTIKDASGAEVGRTGTIGFSQDEYVISGPSGLLAKISGGDSEINIMGRADSRLILMASAYNDWADWRDSAARRHEREPRGGRHR